MSGTMVVLLVLMLAGAFGVYRKYNEGRDQEGH